jgi:hypothetical protein
MRCKKAGEKCFDRNGEAFVPDQAEMTTADGGGRHKLSMVHSHTRAFSRAVGLMKQGYAITRNLRRKSVRAMNMFNKEQFVRARQRSMKALIYVISQIGPPVDALRACAGILLLINQRNSSPRALVGSKCFKN